jgi:hypothetical protein
MEKIPFSTIFIPKIFLYGNWSIKVEYSLRESVSAQGREGRGFNSDPGRNLKKKKKKTIFCLVIRKSR